MSRSGPDLYHRSPGKATLAVAVAGVLFAACGRSASLQGATSAIAPAAAGGQPVSLDEVAPYFVAGEQITWEVTFLGIEGGRARLAVGAPGQVGGRRVVAVVAQAESSGILAAVKRVRDDVSSWIDVESGIPTRTESEIEMKGKRLRVMATRRVGKAIADLLVSRSGGAEVKREQALPSRETHDPISAILLLRSFTAPVGARARFHTLGGLRLWRTDLVVEGKDVVEAPLGRRAALRVSGVSRRLNCAMAEDAGHKPRSFVVWLSDDAQRIPLRVVARTEYGDIEIRATSYEAPVLSRR